MISMIIQASFKTSSSYKEGPQNTTGRSSPGFLTNPATRGTVTADNPMPIALHLKNDLDAL